MNKHLRVAIVGCGNIGLKRINVIKADKKAKIVYLVNTRKTNTLTKICNETGAEFLNRFENIDYNKIDIVILSTHPNVFFKYGKKIILNKKHLLIEKPLGLNLKEAKLLTSMSIKNKIILKTGFNHRFDNGVLKAKKLLSNNSIGKIYYVKIEYANGSVRTNKNRIGSLLDIGSHSINLISYFFNDKKINILKSVKNRFEFNIKNKDDNGFIILKFKEILCSVHHSLLTWKNKFVVEISGSKGMIKINSLPKWGTQELILFKRTFPSGVPKTKKYYFEGDNSWMNEWLFFKNLINANNLSGNYEGYYNMRYIFKGN